MHKEVNIEGNPVDNSKSLIFIIRNPRYKRKGVKNDSKHTFQEKRRPKQIHFLLEHKKAKLFR